MISESIFNGIYVTVPFADVQHIEKQYQRIYENNGSVYPKQIGTNMSVLESILVITKHTKYNFEKDFWENPISISNHEKQADKFIASWCIYRSELETEPK